MRDDDPKSTGAQASRVAAHDITLRFTHQLRLAVRELARRLVAEDKLEALDDVFYLTVEEALGAPSDSRLRIKRRITERERLQAVRLPAVIDTAWTPVAGPDAAQVDDELRGTGLFPGVVEGIVRVVDSAAVAGLQAGDIAVVATADIESVTLLGTPSAVLTDGGIMLADAARAATEFGIPFVAGIAGGSERLCSGMRVRVDGSAGLISVLALDCEVVGV